MIVPGHEICGSEPGPSQIAPDINPGNASIMRRPSDQARSPEAVIEFTWESQVATIHMTGFNLSFRFAG
jgi:hypothetical protein